MKPQSLPADLRAEYRARNRRLRAAGFSDGELGYEDYLRAQAATMPVASTHEP